MLEEIFGDQELLVDKTTIQTLCGITALVCALGAPAELAAQHEEPEAHDASGEQDEETVDGEEGEHGGHEFHRNHFAVFLGSTEAEEHHGEKGDPDFTIGLDYERRLTKLVGVGVMFDWVAEGNREWLAGVFTFLHVYKGAKIQLAPSVHRVREEGDTEFLFRAAFAWDFHVGKISLSPYAAYDFTEGQDFTLLGLAIGTGW